jgi:SNF2 family DNA or RNA helicase
MPSPGRFRAIVSPDGRRITLVGSSPDLVAFYRTLPDPKFDRLTSLWSCLRTPAAAMRVQSHPDIESIDSDLHREGLSFWGGVMRCKHISGPDAQAGLKEPHSKTKAWRQQKAAFAISVDAPATMLAMRMGTGKSKVVVDLHTAWGCENTLILCPKSVVGVWIREFEIHSPIKVNMICPEGKIKEKASVVERIVRSAARTAPGVFVLNYESAWPEPMGATLLGVKWDAVILDESHRVKSHDSLVSKFCAKLGRRAKRRLCLTGTPMGQSPLDLFGQFRFLDPGIYGTYWTEFRGKYAICGNPTIPQQVTGYRNQEELKERMSWVTYHCTAEEVLDLPPRLHIDRRFPLLPKSSYIYRGLETDCLGDVAPTGRSGVITAQNCLVKALRLSQITSGFARVEPQDGSPSRLENIGDEKRQALEDILTDLPAGEPVVVFCRFREDLRRIEETAGKLSRAYGELSGERRDALDTKGRMAPGIAVAGVQMASGGIGVDFTRARYAIYYSLSYSLTEFDQSMARLHRPGQARSVTYYHLVAEDTIDETVYKALEKRKEVIDEILEVFRRKVSCMVSESGVSGNVEQAGQDGEVQC